MCIINYNLISFLNIRLSSINSYCDPPSTKSWLWESKICSLKETDTPILID